MIREIIQEKTRSKIKTATRIVQGKCVNNSKRNNNNKFKPIKIGTGIR